MAGRLSKGKLPKLSTRGKKGNYCFRTRLEGKDAWVSTHTADLDAAKTCQKNFLDSKQGARQQAKTERSAYTLAEKIVRDITGNNVERLPVADAFTKWWGMTPEVADLAARLKTQYWGYSDRLVKWCATKSISFVDQITPEVAKNYASHLWASSITPRTLNSQIGFLSRVFSSLDAALSLPYRDPFGRHVIQRRKLAAQDVARHGALEPEQMEAVIAEAAQTDRDYRDLMVLGAHTGMRLKDAALLEWGSIQGNFINIKPHKTRRSANVARVPIAPPLLEALNERRVQAIAGEKHVFPAIAADYQRDANLVVNRTKRIFERALGVDNTNVSVGKHRKNRSSVLSFHSFRATMTSLLASRNVPVRDAMRIMGWESMQMVLDYERQLKRPQEEADARALEAVSDIEELNKKLPDVAKHLRPTVENLAKLVERYSNIAIGQIFDMTEAGVRRNLDKFGIKRKKRIESPGISKAKIEKIRHALLEGGKLP